MEKGGRTHLRLGRRGVTRKIHSDRGQRTVIGLVIVSHSQRLAEGVKEIADQMADGQVKIVAVGGILDDAGATQLGTDATRIAQAIDEVWSEEGVLLLMDMGSAVLSAEMALELIPIQRQERCLLSNAPLVEGAIVAALQASLCQSLEEVNHAAESALNMKKIERL